VNDGRVLFDSNVICEYFDGLDGKHRLIRPTPRARLLTLRTQSLAQGIADAGIAARWEAQRRPAHLRWPDMHAGQIAKIAAACDLLEQELLTPARVMQTALRQPIWVTSHSRRPSVGLNFGLSTRFAPERPRLAAWYAPSAPGPRCSQPHWPARPTTEPWAIRKPS